MLEEIKQALNEGLSKNKEDIEKSIEEKVNPLSEKVNGIDERLQKVEESPIVKNFNVNTKFEKKFRGYNLDSQGVGILEKVSKNPAEYPAFNDTEKFHNFKKHILSIVRKTNQMQEDTDSEGGYRCN